MRPLSRDTHPDAERVQIELLREATPTRKFALSQSMTADALRLQRRALQELHPDMDRQALDVLMVALNYGEELAARVRACMMARTS